MFIKQVHHKL